MRTTLYTMKLDGGLSINKGYSIFNMILDHVANDLTDMLGEEQATEIIDNIEVAQHRDNTTLWDTIILTGRISDNAEAIVKLHGKTLPITLFLRPYTRESQKEDGHRVVVYEVVEV